MAKLTIEILINKLMCRFYRNIKIETHVFVKYINRRPEIVQPLEITENTLPLIVVSSRSDILLKYATACTLKCATLMVLRKTSCGKIKGG